MSASSINDLANHIGHNIVCVAYAYDINEIHNVSLECEDCNEVLVSYDAGEE